MILIYTISHCYVSIKTKDTKTVVIPLVFLLAGVINILSWFIVYQYVRKLSKENWQNSQRCNDMTSTQNQIQIRYNADGRIDILQDLSGLSPGVYSIAPVRKPSTSTVLMNNGIQNNLMVYPSPDSGIYFYTVLYDQGNIMKHISFKIVTFNFLNLYINSSLLIPSSKIWRYCWRWLYRGPLHLILHMSWYLCWLIMELSTDLCLSLDNVSKLTQPFI